MVIATCALKSAENVSYVVAYVRVAAGRFWAGFPLGIGRTPSDRCNTLTTGRESLLGPSLGVPAGAYQISTIETTIVARTGRRRPPLPA